MTSETTKTRNNRVAQDAFLLCESLEFARRELINARIWGMALLKAYADVTPLEQPLAEAAAQIEREQLLEDAFIRYNVAVTRMGWELRQCSML